VANAAIRNLTGVAYVLGHGYTLSASTTLTVSTGDWLVDSTLQDNILSLVAQGKASVSSFPSVQGSILGVPALQAFAMEDSYTSGSLSTATAYFTSWFADRDVTTSNFNIQIVRGQSGATLFRMALFFVNTDGSMTQQTQSSGAAADASGTGVVQVAYSSVPSVAIRAGQALAVEIVQKGATTTPILGKKVLPVNANTTFYSMRRASTILTQNDATTFVSAGALVQNADLFWVGLS